MAEITTYAQHQALETSEKVVLVVLQAAKRLLGWTVHSGSVYVCAFTDSTVVTSIEQDGTALTAVASIVAINAAGKYFVDSANGLIYLRATGSVNPNGVMQACTFKLFFSNVPVKAPYDLSTGATVQWVPYVRTTSEFGVEIDTYNQFGLAIEGSGSINFINDQSYWGAVYDKFAFENQLVLIYSWNRDLPIAQAKLIYRGRIQKKSWSPEEVKFELRDALNELRSQIVLPLLSELSGARLPAKLDQVPQRLLYGRCFGVKGTNYDQPVGGYPLTGTITTVNGSPTLTGASTAFISEISPGDTLYTVTQSNHTVLSVDSNTQITLTQNYSGLSAAGQTFLVKAASPRRNQNRKFSIAGHALREPSTTITAINSDTEFDVGSVLDLKVDDTVIINSQSKVIRKIYGTTITLTAPLNSPASIGDTVLRAAIQNVYLNDRLLTRTTDYTYTASAGTLLLNALAEVNVAPVTGIAGTLTFNSTTAVTGSGTFFKKEVKISDWIRLQSQNSFFEVLSINSDTSITLRSAASYSASGTGGIKSPEYYEEGKVVLSCDVLGATDDGTTSGALLEKCGDIVEDLLDRAGLTSLVSASTFASAQKDNPASLGIAIPDKYDSKKVPSHRDVINMVNKSVFGSLVQNEDFQLEYQILQPQKTNVTTFSRADVIKFSVDSASDRIIKTARVNYRPLEYDIDSGAASVSQAEATSEYGQYLAKTENVFEIDTFLVDDSSGEIYANRWGFILGIGASVVKIETKLQAARLQATDRVELQHEKLYERFASSDQRRIGAVRYVKQNAFTVSIEVEDVGNAFSRCATITEDTLADFVDSTAEERAYNGYITDDYGMQDNDPDTAGNNVIW